MSGLHFIVPGPPKPWQRAASKNGIRFTPKEMREYQAHIAFCASVVRPTTWPKDRRYSVTLHVVQKDQRRTDVDNYGKAFLDALNDIAWDDDCQVDELHVKRSRDAKSPRVEVTVEVVS